MTQEVYVRGRDGNQIYCVESGAGSTVLLAHGYLMDLDVYDDLAQRLVALGHRVIAFDQRGHRRTTLGSEGNGSAAAASDYAAVIEHFAIDDATLVGHSMGGFLALVFCLRHPELARRFKRLVLLGANAGAVAVGSLQNRMQMPLVKSGLMKTLWRFPPTGRALVGTLFGRSPNPAHVELTRQTLLRQDLHASMPLLIAMSHENYYDRLPEIGIPARVICGELDRTCPAWHSQRLGRDLRHAQTRWLPDIGHMLGYEAPEVILEAVTA
ncbi:MAG TPA: alpha/beta hydrolase [Polyangiales bacterium]|nr:alpha/beta hydrolase [Polyangiales bacterium]